MADLVFINVSAHQQFMQGKTLEQIGREFQEAMEAAHEGRMLELPDWMALSIDGDPRDYQGLP